MVEDVIQTSNFTQKSSNFLVIRNHSTYNCHVRAEVQLGKCLFRVRLAKRSVRSDVFALLLDICQAVVSQRSMRSTHSRCEKTACHISLAPYELKILATLHGTVAFEWTLNTTTDGQTLSFARDERGESGETRNPKGGSGTAVGLRNGGRMLEIHLKWRKPQTRASPSSKAAFAPRSLETEVARGREAALGDGVGARKRYFLHNDN